MNIPHKFPSIVSSTGSRSVLLIGAGMSQGIAPPVSELTNEIRINHEKIIQKFKINPQPLPANENAFYDWAEEVFNQFIRSHGLQENEAKLQLADALGVTSDPRFHAKTNIPLRGNTPKHRVVARLSRENRLSAIWSLNWDCILESALESVGLQPHPSPGAALQNPLPWRKWYCTWSPKDQHNPNTNQDCTLHVVKPHGCINKLATGNATSFIATKSEIAQLPAHLAKIVNGRMHVGLSDAPLITVGWSADEEYIHDALESIKQQGTLIQQTEDRLSIINRSWYPKQETPPPQRHERLAAIFNIARNSCHFPAGGNDEPSIDELFLWLQTLYGLEQLDRYATENGKTIQAWSRSATDLRSIKDYFSQPVPSNWLNSLFDDFLSVWVRLCCNANKVSYQHLGVIIQPNVVATHRRDEHIPWEYGQTARPDLLAAIPLILALRGHEATNANTKWNLEEFPGALWDGSTCHLVVPLPAWNESNTPIELAALKPLTEAHSWPHKGNIKMLSILPLLPKPAYAPVNDDAYIFRGAIAWLMKSSKFSTPSNIGVVSLADI